MKKIEIPAHELLLWRDSLCSEIWGVENGEPPGLTERFWGGVSLLDRIVASMELHLVNNDVEFDGKPEFMPGDPLPGDDDYVDPEE